MYRKTIPDIYQEIMEVLDILPVLKTIQIKIYIKKIKPKYKDEYISDMIEKMKKEKLLFEPVEGYISRTTKITNEIKKTETFFWVYLALMKDEKIPFSKAKYPADYILVKDDKLIEVILYEDKGEIKLGFVKHRKKEFPETILLILLSNENENVIPEELKPFEQHQIISVYKDNEKIDSIPKFKASQMYKKKK